MKKTLKIFACMILLVTMMVTAAQAYVPYNAYEFDYYGNVLAAPAGYVPEKVVFGSDMGIDAMNKPVDIYVNKALEKILILDSGAKDNASRVLILDYNYKVEKQIVDFYDKDGSLLQVVNATGISMDDDGYLYVCDPDSFRVLKMDLNGKTVLKYGAPPREYTSESFVYRPIKLEIGINGSIFVISKGSTDGIMEFDTKGTFVRFFGAPEVQLDLTDLLNVWWRNIYRSVFGADSDQYFVTYVPSEFVNLFTDEHGFVFTMVGSNASSTDEVYKLNFIGKNILDPTQKSTQKRNSSLSSNYGDLIKRSTFDNVFCDICVDDEGFFTLLDTQLGKVFEYDKEGNLIFVYANQGNTVNQIQIGLLKTPTSLAKHGKKTLVLDSDTGGMTVYKLSSFGEQLHEAVILYNEGKYEEAKEPWNEVLKYDANSELAHIGLGKVHMLQSNYGDALDEFKLGNDRYNYSTAFKLYRDEIIRSNFGWFMTVIVVLVVLLFVWKKFGKIIVVKIKGRKAGDA